MRTIGESHRPFFEHLAAGGRVWRTDKLNGVCEVLTAASIGGAEEIDRFGFRDLHIMTAEDTEEAMPRFGVVPGTKHPGCGQPATLEDDRELVLDAICGVEPAIKDAPRLEHRGLGRPRRVGTSRWLWDRDKLERLGTPAAIGLYRELKAGQAQERSVR